MFTITFENETYQRWEDDFIFAQFEDAKRYLLQQGFTEKNRIFERKDYNWSKFIRAYIQPKKLYAPKSASQE